MTPAPAITRAIEELGLGSRILAMSPMGGGCIADVRRLELDSGHVVVAKCAADQGRLQEEADGLRALGSTGTVTVPEVLALVEGALLLEHLAPAVGGSTDWAHFGRQLAALHTHDAGLQYGWRIDNHLGDTPQRNTFHDDWVHFNRECRFGPLREALGREELATAAELARLDALIGGLGDVLEERPHPALIHGDLWSGNALATGDSGVALIDPAVSIGDGLADIAMMRLFGGFPGTCFDAYSRAVGVDLDQPESVGALECYRLYHVLNHWLLFGRGYAEQALGLMQSLLR